MGFFSKLFGGKKKRRASRPFEPSDMKASIVKGTGVIRYTKK